MMLAWLYYIVTRARTIVLISIPISIPFWYSVGMSLFVVLTLGMSLVASISLPLVWYYIGTPGIVWYNPI